MAEIKWIKITTSIFDDEAIKVIEQMPEGDAILVIWFKLLVQAGIINDSGLVYFKKDIPYTEDMLAVVFHKPVTLIRLALTTFEKFGMIEIADNRTILIRNWEKHQNIETLDIIREQTRKRVKKYRERQKLLLSNPNCNVTPALHVTQCNAVEEDKEEDLERDNEYKYSLSLIEENEKKKNEIEKKENQKKVDPYINKTNSIFIDEYQKVFNSKPCLMANQRNKLAELAAEVENFRDTIPLVLEKLKNINFSLPNFTPNYIWLLNDDNYIKVLSGTYDKKKTEWDIYCEEMRGKDPYGN